MSSTADSTAACGHSVPPGSRVCPECGTSVGEGTVTRPRWPWEVSDDAAAGAGRPGPGHRRLLTATLGGVAVVVIAIIAIVVPGGHSGHASAGATHPATHAAAGAHKAAVKPVDSVSGLLDPAGKFFGVEVNGAPDSMRPVEAVAAEAGQTPNLVGQFVEWNAPFDATAATNTLNSGALYYMSWQPFGTTVSAIAAGGSDSYVTAFARAVRAFGRPVAISFGHEFNGYWYPWGTQDTKAASFVAAWRHIHDIFTAVGASNVIWVWDPNIINVVSYVGLKQFWPGDSYVDWIGLSGYVDKTGAHTFDGVFGPSMTEIREFTSKPFIIAETAVQTGPEAVESVRDLVNGVKERRDVLGFVWFDYNKDGVDWSLGDRPSIRATMVESLLGIPLVNLDRLLPTG
jgi:mannan endo-1,4-beta-mannosidase